MLDKDSSKDLENAGRDKVIGQILALVFPYMKTQLLEVHTICIARLLSNRI